MGMIVVIEDDTRIQRRCTVCLKERTSLHPVASIKTTRSFTRHRPPFKQNQWAFDGNWRDEGFARQLVFEISLQLFGLSL
jgi:hypothetical protein